MQQNDNVSATSVSKVMKITSCLKTFTKAHYGRLNEDAVLCLYLFPKVKYLRFNYEVASAVSFDYVSTELWIGEGVRPTICEKLLISVSN